MRIERGELPNLLGALEGKFVVCVKAHHRLYNVGDRHLISRGDHGYMTLGNTGLNGRDAEWEVCPTAPLDLNSYL